MIIMCFPISDAMHGPLKPCDLMFSSKSFAVLLASSYLFICIGNL